jgi:hypothetical protein
MREMISFLNQGLSQKSGWCINLGQELLGTLRSDISKKIKIALKKSKSHLGDLSPKLDFSISQSDSEKGGW